MIERVKKFLKKLYHDLVTINDTPHRIAGGFAIGVFMGILPVAGPMAAVVVAWVFRVNRVAAFAGGLLTNSWLSVVTLALAVKIGAALTETDAGALLDACKDIFRNFNWRELFDISILEILEPIFAGYAVIAAAAGVVAYAGAFFLIHRRRKNNV